jgi:hypothetical protein
LHGVQTRLEEYENKTLKEESLVVTALHEFGKDIQQQLVRSYFLKLQAAASPFATKVGKTAMTSGGIVSGHEVVVFI